MAESEGLGDAAEGGQSGVVKAGDGRESPPNSPRLRQTTFGATLDFIEALCDASSRLTSFPPVNVPSWPLGVLPLSRWQRDLGGTPLLPPILSGVSVLCNMPSCCPSSKLPSHVLVRPALKALESLDVLCDASFPHHTVPTSETFQAAQHWGGQAKDHWLGWRAWEPLVCPCHWQIDRGKLYGGLTGGPAGGPGMGAEEGPGRDQQGDRGGQPGGRGLLVPHGHARRAHRAPGRQGGAAPQFQASTPCRTLAVMHACAVGHLAFIKACILGGTRNERIVRLAVKEAQDLDSRQAHVIAHWV